MDVVGFVKVMLAAFVTLFPVNPIGDASYNLTQAWSKSRATAVTQATNHINLD